MEDKIETALMKKVKERSRDYPCSHTCSSECMDCFLDEMVKLCEKLHTDN